MISVTINGKRETLERPMALPDLLAARNVNRKMIAVGHNGEVVHRGDYDTVVLRDGDTVDIVQMVGGG